MRVTLQQKKETRYRLMHAAKDLFRDQGFANTTTRHIAERAQLASGTMFNYFPSKEDLALALVVELMESAHSEFHASRRLTGTLDEWLFALVSTELRHIGPTRSYLNEILRTGLQPTPESGAMEVRHAHLTQVRDVLGSHGINADSGAPGWEHLYWSLYLGVLVFWSADQSANQQATMALLDRAIGMFGSLIRNWPSDQFTEIVHDD